MWGSGERVEVCAWTSRHNRFILCLSWRCVNKSAKKLTIWPAQWSIGRVSAHEAGCGFNPWLGPTKDWQNGPPWFPAWHSGLVLKSDIDLKSTFQDNQRPSHRPFYSLTPYMSTGVGEIHLSPATDRTNGKRWLEQDSNHRPLWLFDNPLDLLSHCRTIVRSLLLSNICVKAPWHQQGQQLSPQSHQSF